jgi:hypothetical protein
METAKNKLEIWALIAEIVAAVGVIVSVIYLAVEIGEGTATLRAQTHHNLLSMANASFEHALEDEKLAEIVARGMAEPDSLSEAEWYRFSLYQLLAFNAWEYGYYLNAARSTPPELWEGLDAYYRELVESRSGLRRFWKEYHHAFAEPFHSYVNARFDER